MGVKRLSFGGKLIVLSALIAVASMLMDWANAYFLFWKVTSRTGVAIGAALVLAFWLYPLSVVFARKRVSKSALSAIVVIAVVMPLFIAVKIDQKWFVDAGPGVVVFLLACILLAFGMILNQWQPAVERQVRPVPRNLLRDSRCGRCCWINDGDLDRHVLVQVLHATGRAKFSLEPGVALLENQGLHPWALGEAHVLVRHHERQIRATWRNHTDTKVSVDTVASGGALHRVGKIIGAAFGGLFGRLKRS
jgi:hypothetical protein